MVLTGYRNTGTYAPENWFLAVEGERDIGCLLLSEHAGAIWEIVYMALVPEARGRGMGKSLVRFAQWHAGRLGAGSLVLAVDERNLPALRGYEDCGFILLERRRLLTKRLRSRHETD